MALAVVIVTNPYLFADWGPSSTTSTASASSPAATRCSGSRSATAGVLRAASAWALGILPGLRAVAGGIALLVKGRRREAIVLGSLIILYWLYMGSQSRFYARWMLPLYPALAILAAYASR